MGCTVNEALIWIKEAIASRRFHIIPRPKNNDGMLELGLTRKTVANLIASLTPRNYCSGPEDDRDRPDSGEIWLYGEDVGGVEAYIKIKLYIVDDEKYAKCISIHPASMPMRYQR